jgi:predicted nucleic acid-binding protein
MILPDTSVWIEHFSRPNPQLVDLLDKGEVVLHPFVMGEIALGNLRSRQRLMWFLSQVDAARQAKLEDVLTLIGQKDLGGSGIGYVDAHLLASCLLMGNCLLWTNDRRLAVVAQKLGVTYPSH